MTEEILIAGGRIVDPAEGWDGPGDLRVRRGRIVERGGGLRAGPGARVIDARGLVVAPGLIDVHTHLREPGREDEETIESGARAGAAGGFTALCAMPNTDPPTDNQAAVGFLLKQAARAGYARVYPVGAITLGLKGEALAEVGEQVRAGAVAVTDDGHPVRSAQIMRRVLEYTKLFGIPVISHCEEPSLSENGVMNEGVVSTRLGLKGIPKVAEDVMVARDLALAEFTGGRIHLAHVSTRGAVELIRRARAAGVRVTAEVTPHHFSLTEEACVGYNTNAKVNPPLRTEGDRQAVIAGLKEGTIDCIATDHAPHHYDEKEKEFNYAPFGMVGLETALGLALTHLVHLGHLSLSDLVARMSLNPARAMGLPGGTLAVGAVADITIFSPDEPWLVDRSRLLSRSANTPFHGHKLLGTNKFTIVDGSVVWEGSPPQGP